MTEPIDTSLSSMDALGLVSEEQRKAAASHPERASLPHDAGTADYLVWMVRHRMLSQVELILMVYDGDAGPDDPLHAAREELLAEVLQQVEVFRPGMNAELFDELQANELLTEDERSRAGQAPIPLVLSSAGVALAHLVACGVLMQTQFDQLRARVQASEVSEEPEESEESEERAQQRAQRSRIMDEADIALRAIRMNDEEERTEAAHRLMRKAIGQGLLVLFIGVGIGAVIYPWKKAVPDCDGTETKQAIYSMFTDIPRRAGVSTPVAGPSLSQIKEIGYASGPRKRGCTATVNYLGETLPYAYVVSPIEGEQGGFSVGGMSPAIVEARFRKVGDDGEFANKAEPVGRGAVESALRAAIEEMRGPGYPPMLAAGNRPSGLFNRIDPDRTREIADLEPIGACRTVQPGTKYACRVLIERNDPIRSMIGAPPEILDGEFNFERASGSNRWIVSDDFQTTYAGAILKARGLASKPEDGT